MDCTCPASGTYREHSKSKQKITGGRYDTETVKRHLNTIVETYGSDKQEDMAIEECSELIKAILKFRRSNAKDSDLRDAVIDEIADVQIMLTQLGIIFNCVEEVNERIDFKIDRQIGRIKEREAKRDVC